jgi:signal transduction histidine kinase
LHRLLHGNCADPECGLSVFWRGALEQLLEGRRVKQECWDPRLRRHLSILLQPPVYQPRAETHNQPLAIATVEDISEIHAQEEQRVGDALRETRRELQRLSLQHVNIRENERRRMAMDLHDGLGQSLNLLKLSLQETARLIEQQKCKNSAQALYGLAHSVEAIVVEVRRIAMDLRPSTLDDLGLIPTLSWFFREFQARCPRPKVVRRIEISEADVPEPMKLAIYRLLQEATCNALRHASADVIEVRLHKDADGLHFSVADDGCGFDKTATSGLGLQSMRERAELLGGVYAVCSKPGNGTRVSVTWPLAAQQSAGAPDESLVGRVRVVLDSVDPANALRSSL